MEIPSNFIKNESYSKNCFVLIIIFLLLWFIHSYESMTIKGNLMEKSKYLIDGFGYSCSRSKITIKTFKNFFGNENSIKDIKIESMDREDCMAMIISKKCHYQVMTCQGDSCQSILR